MRGVKVRRWLLLAVWLVLGQSLSAQAPTAQPAAPPAAPLNAAEDEEIDARIDALMAGMAVEDKVGQLFIVNFRGSEVGFESDIALLIHGYRVGGVVLSPANGNFTNDKGTDTPAQAAALTNRLQALAYGRLLPEDQALEVEEGQPFDVAGLPALWDGAAEAARPPVNLPLLIGVEQFGDDIAHTALRRGFTELPSPTALGATWNPDLVSQVGQIVGRELRAVGVNLLLGPSLDVWDHPRTDELSQLGMLSFGGDPFWVTQMGRAYIAGVHQGSNGGVLAIARHFPGQGNVDRLPDEEVATIQGGLEDLRRLTLPPFLAVTRQASSLLEPGGDVGAADGLMTSHMRYSTWQGVGSNVLSPLSLYSDLPMIFQQEGLGDWRQRGLVMTGPLGARAVRRYYDPTLAEFPYRRAALDAFNAGHDLLYLSQFSADEEWETELVNIEATITFFQERYRTEPDFAAQVDAAVRRILNAKLRLYGGEPAALAEGEATPPLIPLEAALTTRADLAMLAPASASQEAAAAVVGQVAREALTLLYPEPARLADTVPGPPQESDSLLILTDSRLVRECSQCVAEALVGPDKLADIIVRLYGPEATGQLSTDQIESVTFAELTEVLDDEPSEVMEQPTAQPPVEPAGVPAPEELADDAALGGLAAVADSGTLTETVDGASDKRSRIEAQIAEADWLIFAMLDADTTNSGGAEVLKRFLRERSDQLLDKRVVVLGLNAPYFLDATEISKLSAFFGVYSRSEEFLENGMRAAFRSLTPTGAPPVSVPGTRFADLNARLQPDASQQLPMQVLAGEAVLATNSGSESDNDVQPALAPGSAVRVQVGPIMDFNGRPVADGTRVDFQAVYEDEALALTVAPALTRGGVASRELVLERGGIVRISASCGQATAGSGVTLVIAEPALAAGDGVTSTQLSTTTVDASAATTTTEPLTTTGQTVLPSGVPVEPVRRINATTLVLTLLTMAVMLCLLLIAQVRIVPRRALFYNMLWAVIVGLMVYILYGVGLIPGGNWLFAHLDVWAASLVVFVGMLLPLLWLQLWPQR